jgi:hypothetical protein
MRVIYVRGRQDGLRETVAEIAKGVHSNRRNKITTPTRIESCVQALRVVSSIAQSPKDEIVVRHLRRLGTEMAAAGEHAVREEPKREELPSGHIRLELSLRELVTVRWLAHAGFKLMMQNEPGHKFSFRDEKDAQESTFAIDRIEWSIPDQNKDPKAPYAMGLCRQKLIWERWPNGSAAQQDMQNAA